jgi:glutamate-1-semialdehyde 2,1-aminomutase
MNGDLASPMTWVAGAGALAYLFVKVKTRLELSKAKHPSLRGHARMSRMVAKWVPFYEYDEEHFFNSDDAPPEIAARRREAFWRLVKLYQERFPETRRLTEQAAPGISDLQFTSAYRVPFQYRGMVSRNLKGGSFYRSSSGVTLTDADGNTFHDVSGSYGVNVLATTSTRAASSAAPSGSATWGPSSAAITRSWPTTSSGCARSPDWTRCRSTCPEPRR